MILKRIVVVAFVLFLTQTKAQIKEKVLFTVDKEPVYTSEFLRVFNKNRDIVEVENQKTIEEYLELYVNYKLKLKQAYQLGLDTVDSYKRELKKYRQQLVLPYLKDSKVTDELVKEAYNRLKTEVNASHILIKLTAKASPVDTLKAYNRIIEARDKVLKGMPFNDVAKLYSEDPSAKKNGGSLGYFSVFGMVYPFENAAYNNNIGNVSMPFKTRFGYHIINVNDKRLSRGEVEVAHIMIKNNAKDSTFAKKQIAEVYAKLQQGDAFDFLAKQYSDDKNSALKGGKLAKFSTNRMITSFSDVAFSLENENDISKPFQTNFGWHIVKLIKKHPIQSFDNLKDELAKKIEKSERAAMVGESIAERLKKQYDINVKTDVLASFFMNDSASIAKNKSNTIFSINNKKVKLKELINYNVKQHNKSVQIAYKDFLNQEVLNYYKNNLENTDKEFAFTMQEYRDGLLLFDLLQDKIWTRSEKDTIALKNFFDANHQNYMWRERADLILATCTNVDKAVLVKKYLEANKSINEIKDLVNEGATINVLFSEGILEKGNKKLPNNFTFVKGVSQIFDQKENHFVIVKVNEIIAPSQKKLKEAKGMIINDFQEHLEKQWIAELKEKYIVKINKRTLKKLIKQNQ